MRGSEFAFRHPSFQIWGVGLMGLVMLRGGLLAEPRETREEIGNDARGELPGWMWEELLACERDFFTDFIYFLCNVP